MEPDIVIDPDMDEYDLDDTFELVPIPPTTRCEAVLWIDEQQVLDGMILFLTGQADTREFQLRVTLDCIPKDVKVLRATHSWERRAMGFVLSHPSFALVPDGCPAPDITYDRLVWEYVPKPTT